MPLQSVCTLLLLLVAVAAAAAAAAVVLVVHITISYMFRPFLGHHQGETKYKECKKHQCVSYHHYKL